MFVSVDMRNRDSGRLNLTNLRAGFRNNFIGVDAASDRSRRESHHAIAEVCAAGKSGKLLGVQNWLAINQHHVATDAQSWDRLCQSSRLCESRSVGHERRRSHDTAGVSLHNAPVHARSEAKV